MSPYHLFPLVALGARDLKEKHEIFFDEYK